MTKIQDTNKVIKVGLCTYPLLSGHKTRGIGFYTKYLLEHLKKNKPHSAHGNAVKIQEFGDVAELKDVDLVHYPFFDLFNRFLPFSQKYPTVITIHDLIPIKFKEHYPPGIKGTLNFNWQKMQAKKAEAIVTDSEASKKDIHELLGIPNDKIHVVYLSSSEQFKKITDKKRLDKVIRKHKLPKRFCIFTGNVNWNKNLVNMTQACISAEVNLVLVGSSFENRDNLNHPELRSYKLFLEKYSKNKLVHILGFMEEEDLISLVNAADILLLPSFYEGFGLTILEAQACGTPVITSNISSMPEVAGKGAMLVDPYNSEEIKEAILKIYKDKKLQQSLITEGTKNLKRFSWKKSAEETIKVYESVI